MKQFYILFFTLISFPSLCFGQVTKPDLILGIGSSINILNQQNRNDWNNTSTGINIGFFTNRLLTENYSLWFGFSYNFISTNNYLNTVQYIQNWNGGPETMDINLKTSLNLQFLQIPIILKRHFHNRFSVGAGLNLSILTSAKFSQEAIGNYSNSKYPLAGDDLTRSIKYVFGVTDFVSEAPFTKTNVAPMLNLGYCISKKISLEYFLSYDLLANPRLEYKFNEYNSFTNNINFTLKIN